ncbi:2-dehydropantoate 2-reductase [Nocardiopsis sp. CNT-189]|uniref:ketopantoate reductase family protein n=1 Tax=Nocardiopsis oceanisediminis TaxID=2816862 RepID=UPI003B31DBBC
MAETEYGNGAAGASGQGGEVGRIAVLSPGGVGGLLAGLLARDGRDVAVVATESTAAGIAEHGLRVESRLFGDFTVHPSAAPRLEGRADVLFVGCKATALHEALERVPAEAVQDALVVPLLNGLEHMEALRRAYPGARVAGAAIRVESTRVEPGRIVQSSPFALLDLAAEGVAGDRFDALVGAVRAAGLDVEVRESEADVLWKKLHFLLPTALVCTYAGLPIGGTRTGRRTDLLGVAAEVEQVAGRYGVDLDTDVVLRMFDAIPEHTKPSMLRDREAGRAMEVDALGGAFLRRAREAGVPTPVAERIVADLEQVDAALRAG